MTPQDRSNVRSKGRKIRAIVDHLSDVIQASTDGQIVVSTEALASDFDCSRVTVNTAVGRFVNALGGTSYVIKNNRLIKRDPTACYSEVRKWLGSQPYDGNEQRVSLDKMWKELGISADTAKRELSLYAAEHGLYVVNRVGNGTFLVSDSSAVTWYERATRAIMNADAEIERLVLSRLVEKGRSNSTTLKVYLQKFCAESGFLLESRQGASSIIWRDSSDLPRKLVRRYPWVLKSEHDFRIQSGSIVIALDALSGKMGLGEDNTLDVLQNGLLRIYANVSMLGRFRDAIYIKRAYQQTEAVIGSDLTWLLIDMLSSLAMARN